MPATHSILTKSTKPFILHYSVIAIVLHFSVSGKACLMLAAVGIISFPKARGKGIDRGMTEEYNHVCPHISLGYRPPAPEARVPLTLT